MSVNVTRDRQATIVNIGELTFLFSYETCVAFRTPATGWVVSQNIWSVNTGRHLNLHTPSDIERLPYKEFAQRLDEAMAKVAA